MRAMSEDKQVARSCMASSVLVPLPVCAARRTCWGRQRGTAQYTVDVNAIMAQDFSFCDCALAGYAGNEAGRCRGKSRLYSGGARHMRQKHKRRLDD